MKDITDTTDMEIYQDFVEGCKKPSGYFKEQPKWFLQAYWAAGHGCCEMAEVLELFEKAYRKGIELDKDKVMDEIGDTLWCLTAVANACGLDMDEVILHNINKLKEREREAAK